jgi:steroid delta-isomerase-like uncharacterized protein
MTSAEIRSFIDRFVRAWESQDPAKIGACYADACEVVSPIFSTLHGRAEVEKSFAALVKAFALQRIRVDEVVISGDDSQRAAVVLNMQSTHVGEVFGMPASGKKIERTIAFFLTLKDDAIVREQRIYDFTSMLMELGVLKVKPGHAH